MLKEKRQERFGSDADLRDTDDLRSRTYYGLMEKLQNALGQSGQGLDKHLLSARSNRNPTSSFKKLGVLELFAALKEELRQERSAHRATEEQLERTATLLGETQKFLQEERTAFQQNLAQWSQQAQAVVITSQEAEKSRLRLEAQLAAADQNYRDATELVTGQKHRLLEEESARRRAEQSLREATTQLDQVRSEFRDERNMLQQRWEGEITTVRARLDEANQKYRGATEQITTLKQKSEGELSALRTRLEETNQKYRGATEQIAGLKQRVTEEETARRKADQSVSDAEKQMEQTQRSLHEERNALKQELTQLAAEVQAKTVSVHEGEKKLIRLEGNLELANQKYRGITEQVTALKEQLAQEVAAHRSTEQTLTAASHEAEKTRLVQETELSAVRSRLEEANQKYRGITEQVTALKEQLAQEVAARQRTEQAVREAAAQLDQANCKYREVTGRQIPELKHKLETKESKVREGQHILEQFRLELRQQRKTLAETGRQLERARQEKNMAEQQVSKTRATISFRLGYLLTHNIKSVNGFLRLPSELWALRNDASQRRKKKVFIPGLFKPLPSSERSVTVPPPAALPAPIAKEILSSGYAIPSEVPLLPAVHPVTQAIPNRKLKIACIMDEFTFSSFQPECSLHQLTPGNWKAEIEASKPDLLFIESAWRGKDELWGSKVGHTSTEVQGIVDWCRWKKVPTVFWNKEDPIHFETFLSTAKLFDFVFTTDIDCIHRYKAALGHDRVYLLPFACQPAISHPIETHHRKDAFCFAGAYYVRYPERTRDLGDFVTQLPGFRPVEIYDRNYGKNDPNYQFPPKYQPYIVGTLPFGEIDKAYKGYRYAINLNSIKQSQTMFARRVYELLASNTITVSNFSQGLRLLFGDLVITSDSGTELVRRLNQVAGNEEHSRKLRLAGLRKVMKEHTYGQRLSYIVSKVSGKPIEQSLVHITVLAYAASHAALERLEAHYRRQRYANSSFYVVLGDGIVPSANEDFRVHFIRTDQASKMTVGGLDRKTDLIAGMVSEDYYGPNYLQDIALATCYTEAELIGKAARYIWNGAGIHLMGPSGAYRPVQSLPARAAAVRQGHVAKENLLEWVQLLGTRQLQVQHGLAIDEFNYCENAGAVDSTLLNERVDDLPGLDTGISIGLLQEKAERILPESKPHDDCPIFTGKQLAQDFSKKPSSAVTLEVDGQIWRVGSTLPDGKHEYLYATADHSLSELGFTDQLKMYFDVTPGLNVQLVVVFIDAQKQKISNIIMHANRNQAGAIPPGTARIRFGLRFYAGGHAEIKGLVLGHRNLQPAEIIAEAEYLLLTNHYPSYSDLYRNGFVHTRVRAYQSRGVRCDVFRLRIDEAISYHEFENVNVITASQEVLHQLLSSGRYKSVLVHFLDSAMWDVLQHHIERVKVLVWVHGAEIRPWHRRRFDFQIQDQIDAEKQKSEKRTAFWRELLQSIPPNFMLIFVSRYSAEEVMQDLGVRIPEQHYIVIHNPIDTDLFRYQPKGIEQRKKVLSIRPYASKLYANDLSVKAIELLAQEPWFNDMEFRMIGDGPLFEGTIGALRKYKNVYVEQRFLTRDEMAALHRDYGIFLCPTRMDTQGVSRDEAMASGLVPVTNAVTAIPEFVDDNCGILAPGEDAEAMARGIAMLYEQPVKFSAMSEAAARRVREQRDAEGIIKVELGVVLDDSVQMR